MCCITVQIFVDFYTVVIGVLLMAIEQTNLHLKGGKTAWENTHEMYNVKEI
jgi:hypothetical protein